LRKSKSTCFSIFAPPKQVQKLTIFSRHATGWQGQARRLGSYVGYNGGANGQAAAVRTNNAGDVAAAV
jgi:hypothetical protein